MRAQWRQCQSRSAAGSPLELTPSGPLRIGISSCLLGERVRYNGDHKRAEYLTALAPHVEWIPVCPEVEIGMGVPREPVRLERTPGGTRMVAVQSRTDFTDAMRDFAVRRIEALRAQRICGYVFKKDSPSCGVSSVTVYDGNGAAEIGRGLFAAVLLRQMPALPVEEEHRLADADVRVEFLARCADYRRTGGAGA